MSDKTLSVRITATENASGVLKKVGDAATKAADELKRAGTDGSEGLEKIEQEAQQAAPAVEKVGDSAKRAGVDLQAMGVALTAIGASLAYAGQLAMEHERTVIALQKAYGDAAADMISFADTLASETGNLFNNDDILAGERWFATLRNNYNMTIDQIQEVARITADLAAASGFSYEDSANRVTAALRGEAEAAEALSLTMNQMAIDREGVTLTMSNEEAALFRLNALRQQAAVYQGTAAAIAESDAGKWASLTNSLKDNAQAAGELIGPYGAMVAGFGSAAVGLAQFAGGFAALSTGIRTATAASAAFVASPIGLVVTGLGLALTAVVGTFMATTQASRETAAAWAEAEASGQSLTDQINQMALAGDMFNARFAKDFEAGVFGQLDWFATELGKVLRGENLDSEFGQTIVGLIPDDLLGPAAAAEREAFVNSLMPTPEDEIRLNAALSSLFSLMANPNVDGSKLQQEMRKVFTAFDNMPDGTPIDVLIDGLVRLESQTMQSLYGIEQITQSNWDYIDSVNGANVATQDQTASLEAQLAVRQKIAEEEAKDQAKRDERRLQEITWLEQEDEATRQRVERRRRNHMSLMANAQEYLEALAIQEFQSSRVAGAEILGNQGVVGSIHAVKAAYQEMATAREEELRGMLSSVMGLDDPLTGWNTAGMGDGVTTLAQNVRDAASGLDTVFRVIVGNTDAIANQISGVNDWAEALIGVQGEYAVIDDLLANGRITLDEYNAAQQAQITISEANRTVLEDIQTIQARQAPLIAESTAALSAYVSELSGLSIEQQTAALGWLDASSAARALEINTLGVAAATGELGSNGRAAFQSFIDGVVATDPVMTQMLVQMGAIDEHIDSSGNKTYTINWEGFKEGESSIDRLIDSIDALTLALGGIPPIRLDVQDNASEQLKWVNDYLADMDGAEATVTAHADDPAAGILLGVQSILDDLDGDTATTTAETIDLSSGVIASIRNALANLDGQKATTIIETVYQSRGVSGAIKQAHGGIPGFATGGVANYVPFYGAEGNRPELLHFAMGGTAPIYTEGVYAVPPMTYVSPANANPGLQGGGGLTVQIDVHGNIYGIGDLAEQVTAQIVPAIQEATGTRYREQGVRW